MASKLPKMGEVQGSENQQGGPAEPRAREGATESLVDREICRKAVDRAVAALGAKRIVYGKSKDQFEEHDDWPTIIKAVELLLAYGEGRPIERRLELKGNLATFDQQRAQLMNSPEGIKLLRAAGLITDREAVEALAETIDAPEV